MGFVCSPLIFLQGLETVMPEDTKFYFPRPGKEVIVSFGNPIDFSQIGLLDEVKGLDAAEARRRITDYIFHQTVEVQKETEKRIGEPGWRNRGEPQHNVDHPPRRGDPS